MADRQTRMIDSSVCHPGAKGGAGGQYTWGTAMDVQDFVPVGVTHTNVAVAAAPTYVIQQPAQPMMVSVGSTSHFPSLGGAPCAVPTYAAPTAMRPWGPAGGGAMLAPVVAPDYLQSVAPIRTTVDFGQQHPRNSFAKRPVATTSLSATAPVAIDWSQAGTAAIAQCIQAMPNTAHTSPYVAQHAPVPLSVLQAMPQTTQTMMYQTPSIARPAPVAYSGGIGKVTQGRGR